MEAEHDTPVEHSEEKTSEPCKEPEAELLTVERAKEIMDEVFGNLWNSMCD